MPIGVTNHQAPPPPPDPISPGMLPEEIYIRVDFNDYVVAKNWCDEVRETLKRPISDVGAVDRVVLWAPAPGGTSVYLSVLAMRVVRAYKGGYLPAIELVSMGQLPTGLRMVVGNPADEQAYLRVKS